MHKTRPIREKIEAWLEKDGLLLCMPGHKASPLWPILDRRFDVTEMSFLDDLHDPDACIAESERWMSQLYGTAKTHLLVNGASAGLMASIMSLPAETTSLLLPAQAHKSVLQACILRDLEPVFVDAPSWQGLLLPPEPKAYGLSCAEPALILSPSYEGITCDYSQLSKQNRILIADEAHGSHLYWMRRTTALTYADYVVHGTHKTLGSLTQSALLHRQIKGGHENLRQNLSLVQSSSPSWLVLVSLEDAVQQAQALQDSHGWEVRAAEVTRLKDAIDELPGLSCLRQVPATYGLDPLRLAIRIENGQAPQLYRLLADLGVEMEMVSGQYVVGIMSPWDAPDTDERLLASLKIVTKNMRKASIPKEITTGSLYLKHGKMMNRRQAFFGKKKKISLSESAGRISAGFISIYPPGVAIMLPGDRIDKSHIETLQMCQSNGVRIENLKNDHIWVAEE